MSDDSDDDRIARLLRLKRYEQPPAEYFERFLTEFHQRQRAEMLRRPLWRLALDRMEAFWGEVTFSRMAYAGASAAVLLGAGVFTVDMLRHPGGSYPGGGFASLEAGGHASSVAYEPNPALSAPLAHEPLHPTFAYQAPEMMSPVAEPPPAAVQVAQVSTEPLTLNPRIRMAPEGFERRAIPRHGAASQAHPRYVLDPQPVSYEPPFSF